MIGAACVIGGAIVAVYFAKKNTSPAKA